MCVAVACAAVRASFRRVFVWSVAGQDERPRALLVVAAVLAVLTLLLIWSVAGQDERLRVSTDWLRAVTVVKMYAWERAFGQRIAGAFLLVEAVLAGRVDWGRAG